MKKISIISLIAGAFLALACNPVAVEQLIAGFQSDVTSTLVGDEVTFDDMSTGSPSRWEWTFEGGTPETSNLTQPKVQYMTPGSYTVSLKISNKDGETEIVKRDYIKVDYHSTVKADFEVSATQAFNDEVITLTNLSEGYPETVKWTLTPKEGNPIILTEYSPSQTFPVGVYSIKLEVSNPKDSDSKEVKDALQILDRYAVIADISAENTTTYAGGNVNFKDASTGNAQFWSWTFEGGTPSTSTEQNPVVKYEKEGSYKVSLKTYNDKYESFKEIDGYIRVLPSNDIVFLLPFDGSVNDYGPYGLTPSLYSKGGYDVSFEAPSGVGGKSINLPGGTKGKTYCVLQMPDKLEEAFPNGSEITVSVWVKLPGAVGANTALFAQGLCPGTEGASNQIWARFQTNDALRCTAERTTPKIGITATATGSGLQDGNWHHICIVFDEVNGDRHLSLYKDGKSIKVAKGGELSTVHSLPYFIGCNLRWTDNAWAPENMFKGWMDDYTLYKRALSAAEVAELYNIYQ